MKSKNRKLYSFKYYNNVPYSILFLSITLVFIYLLFIRNEYPFIGVGTIIFVIIVSTLTFLYVSQTGLHFNFRRQKIIMLLGFSLKVIDMNEVNSISLETTSGDREDIIVKKFIMSNNSNAVGTKNMNNDNKYYNINISLVKNEYIMIQGSSFFGSASAGNRKRQYNRFKKIEKRFDEYRKTRSDRMYY